MRRHLLALATVTAAVLLPHAAPTPAAATAGLVTLRTVPAVAGATFSLGGETASTGSTGTATFTTTDLDAARTSVRLLGHDIGSGTRVDLLHVAADPNHAIGARVLVAEVAVSRPVDMQFIDRRGDAVPPSWITGMTVQSSDGRSMTIRPGEGTVWLPSETAVRGVRPPGQSRTLSYTVTGVRVSHISVALGDIPSLQPAERSWAIGLAGYPFNVRVSTEPAVAAVKLRLDGDTVLTDATGAATFYTHSLDNVAGRVDLATHTATPAVRVNIAHISNDGHHAVGSRRIVVGLRVRAAVRFSFVDIRGHHVTPGRISGVTLGGPHGQQIKLAAKKLAHPVWLDASRLTQTSPPQARTVTYTVDGVSTYGTNAVFAGGQRFDPVLQPTWLVRLHLYRLRVSAHDMLFGGQSRGAVSLQAPNGALLQGHLSGGRAVFNQVPRGEYTLQLSSGIRRMSLPVRVARDQVVDVRVVSWTDVFVVLLVVVGLALGVLWLGIRARRKRQQKASLAAALGSAPARISVFIIVAGLLGSLLVAGGAQPARAVTNCGQPQITTKVPAYDGDSTFPIPVWGYYYIWFTPTSWHRAKIDTPQIGCYSSDDPAVMRAHIRMAQAAGITGFLVSWKHTPDLDRRLKVLTRVAREEHFALGIVYESLDFYRQPLPARTVRRDITWFAAHYASNPVYASQGKPVVVWTGTEDYPTPVVAAVATSARQHLTVLASAKSVEDYERVASYVDGDAYYWSSGDPAVPSYPRRLGLIGSAVHAHDGIWLAPAAPGFNARALGGHRNIARNDGTTLRLSLAAALASAPDALGIISWNEWSENTYVEPSVRYGTTDLAVLAEVLHGHVPRTVPTDSSDDLIGQGGWRAWHSLLVIVGITVVTVGAVEQRRRRTLHREVVRALRGEYPQMAGSSGDGREGRQDS